MQLALSELNLLETGLHQGKGFSVITNFGCDMDCWYCIWKKHPMALLQNETNFEKLRQAFIVIGLFQGAFNKKVTVSLSGGGDPLYLFGENQEWFKKFFGLARQYGISVKLHTAKWQIAYNDWLLENLSEVVVHFTYERFLKWPILFEEFSKKIPIRMAFVLTGAWNLTTMQHVVAYARSLDCKISFRELWAVEDKVRPEALKYAERVHEEYSQARYVKQADYNLYYMPDNNIYETFMLEEAK